MTTSKKATAGERPLLSTPTGGTMSQPESPQQWHAHPYVWAWHAGLGALSRDYIERECQTAADAGAPPDAVYKARDDDPTMPGKWITVGMIASADQQKQVREYAKALIAWADVLKGHREQNKVQPLHQVLASGPAGPAPKSEAGDKMPPMNIRADEKPDGEFIEFGLPPSAKRHPLAFGPIAIYLGIEYYTEENAQECQRRAKAFFEVFDDMGEPLLHRADGTPFTAEDIDERFIRHHLGQRPGFGRRTDEDFDEHVAHVRARRTADA